MCVVFAFFYCVYVFLYDLCMCAFIGRCLIVYDDSMVVFMFVLCVCLC